jgi:hypothetical protein
MKNLGLIAISDSITLDLIVKPDPIVLVLTAKKLLGLAGHPDSSFHPKAVRSGWATGPNAIGSYWKAKPKFSFKSC